ncbi:MAG: OB-fold nucleic acid binding domain-containing protein, partial [Candidatus Thermoplasmatota archaeon]|nr:OB-fold nucleic acid binding domain-containing protein [Candidatus Thermoplasmatota archaeon]
MTERVPIGDILRGDRTGQSVKVRGWVYRTRSSGGIAFLLLRDATGVVQSTFRKEEVGDAQFAAIEATGREAAVVIEGTVAEDRRAPGGYEVRGSAFEVVGASSNFPIARDLSEEFLLDVRHLWIRSRRMTSIFKVRSTIFRAIHDYFREEGFYEVQPPIITPLGSEGGSTLFQVRYFDRDLHLTQSWQLYAEALVMALERIYTVAPSFRAEKSRTPRHLTEYWHAEMEVAWEGMEEALRHGEGVLARVAQEVAARNEAELAYLGRDVEYLRGVQPPFPRITYDEAL